MSSTPPAWSGRERATDVGVSVAVMTVANLLNNKWLTRTYVPNSVATTIVLLTHARRSGLSWHQLGLARRTRQRGLVSAAGSVAAVGLAYTVALAVPATRRAFLDQRVKQTTGGAAFQALVPVLLGTVLLEEVAFRGVLWGLLSRRYGVGPATAVSSVLFGLWHILPSRELARHNRAVADAAGGSRSTAAVVLWSVAFTTAAGVVLAELRRRSGSLIAPAGLHWATNGLGYLFAAAARGSR